MLQVTDGANLGPTYSPPIVWQEVRDWAGEWAVQEVVHSTIYDGTLHAFSELAQDSQCHTKCCCFSLSGHGLGILGNSGDAPPPKQQLVPSTRCTATTH